MSNSENTPPRGGRSKQKKSSRQRAIRALSASEIAKNSRYFELWCTCQNLEKATYEDIPDTFKKDVDDIFDVTARLPLAWVDKESEGYKLLSGYAPPEFISFISRAYSEDSSLFGTKIKNQELPDLYLRLTRVFTAWGHLNTMLNSGERWSEADFADVYAEFRRPAAQDSIFRTQCCVSLPQPLSTRIDSETTRIMSARKSIPDCVVMIPSKKIRHLSSSSSSSFNQLKRAVKKTSNAVKESSFSYQATILHSLPEPPAFQFVSSVWEDKHMQTEHAYRQNRMSTASVARHLHSMHVDAPVIGLTWSYGNVRAHIDWCKKPKPDENPIVHSAPYVRSGKPQAPNDGEKEFHEWHLTSPSHILHLHFLIVNIDRWTTGGFLKRVVNGVTTLEMSIVKEGKVFEPWRHTGDIPRPRRSLTAIENAELSASILSSTPPKPKRKARPRAI